MHNSTGMRRWCAAVSCFVFLVVLVGCTEECNTLPTVDDPAEADRIAPARICDLTVARIETTWVRLAWREPGDDGHNGSATAYDLRYADPDTIVWESMTPCRDLPEPVAADSLTQYDVAGLAERTTYRFAIRAVDEAGNWSPSSNALFVRTAGRAPDPDSIPPAPITDLSVAEKGSTWVRLTWTEPGDDGFVDQAAHYDLRYSTAEHVPWEGMRRAPAEPPPGKPGSTATHVVERLVPYTEYWFAIRSRDEERNLSEISNVLGIRTGGKDIVPPSRIMFVQTTKTGITSATIKWWPPGDDGHTGTATAYEIRYADRSSEEDFWEVAQSVPNPPVPLEPGLVQRFRLENLEPNQQVLVGIKAVDEAGNWSAMSGFGRVYTRMPDDVHWWEGFMASPDGQGVDAHVRCLRVHDNLLMAGGDFTRAGDIAANHIAAWDGAEWFGLGTGLSGAVQVLGSYRGHLVAGGDFFGGVAVWSGASWEIPGGGVDDRVVAVAEYGGDLIVAGEFLQAGGVEAIHIARWNGERWIRMDDTTPTPTRLDPYSALAVYDGHLLAAGGGRFDDWADIIRIAEFDGTGWIPWLVCEACPWWEEQVWVKTLRTIGGSMFLGGALVLCEHSDHGINQLGRYESGQWTSLDVPSYLEWYEDSGVYEVAEWNGRLVAAGYFVLEDMNGSSDIAYFENGTWHPLGTGFRSSTWQRYAIKHDGPVYAVAAYQGALYAGGAFRQAGGKPSMYIARWVE